MTDDQMIDDRIIEGRLSDHPSSNHPSSATRLHVTSLTLSHFRNYRGARIEVDERPVVLTGPNGAGKTNILEAISLLTPGRGLRRAKLADMDYVPPPMGGRLGEGLADAGPSSPHPNPPPKGEGVWAVAAELCGIQGAVSVGTGRDKDAGDETDKRIVKIDGKTVRGQVGLAKVFAALWLTPQMDNLFIEGGTARRKFLDRLVYSFDADHASRVNAYDFAMRERNRLLSMGQSDDRWLAALEQKMAEQGVAIAVARAHAAEGLREAMLLSRHSFPRAQFSLAGMVEEALQGGSALAAEEAFRATLAEGRTQDAAAGRTLIGVHRAQVEVMHMEKNMPAEHCSTGEQKALLVSIILAQARAGAAWHGSVPVLLLDEVATHLDPVRRKELYAELKGIGAQAWITGTDLGVFEGMESRFLSVENGKIILSE
jgi:DNA replication and repair protein RecF